ncbi:MAG: hypothetical protein ABJK39_12480 [Hyphomicrobiales bacterium]
MKLKLLVLTAVIFGGGTSLANTTDDIEALAQRLITAKENVDLKVRPIIFQGKESKGQHDCFWMGPVYSGAFNIAYPDGGAVYWPTVFKMPADDAAAYLEISGSFPKARYMSVHSYTKGAKPYDRLIDFEITPDEGANNPYQSGAFADNQAYKIRVMQGEAPKERVDNTLYLGDMTQVDRSPLMIRHYIPETGDDLTGGAGLPQVTLVRGNGDKVSGEEACVALGSPAFDDKKRIIVAPALPQESFDKLLENPPVRENYLNTKKEDWSVFWDPRINLMAFVAPKLQEVMKTAARVGLIEKTSGFYANLDNQYVSLSLNEKFGEVVVLKAKMPRTPLFGTGVARKEDFDIRYWSLCSNEGLVTTRFSACIFDHEIKLTKERDYTIVVSKAANRPANARPECGVSWLDWGDAGDGAGNTGLTNLLLRNMAPFPNFKQAVQHIKGPGLEAESMGEYLPAPVYMTKAEFEAISC